MKNQIIISVKILVLAICVIMNGSVARANTAVKNKGEDNFLSNFYSEVNEVLVTDRYENDITKIFLQVRMW